VSPADVERNPEAENPDDSELRLDEDSVEDLDEQPSTAEQVKGGATTTTFSGCSDCCF